jgi:hypothetical protein
VAPLRKIVGYVEVVAAIIEGKPFMVCREKLECGHLVAEKRDIYGPTNAVRRRCRKCELGKPQEQPNG